MRRPAGFSLGEVLLATLFLSIAFFGYVALHQRIIYSNWKVERRQEPREEVRSELIDRTAAARAGQVQDLPGVPSVAPGLWRLRARKSWTEEDGQNPTPVERSYELDTYVTVRRPGW